MVTQKIVRQKTRKSYRKLQNVHYRFKRYIGPMALLIYVN